MFELINRRLSIAVRVAMVAGCAAPPIALLLYLFIANVSRNIGVTDRELAGAQYVGEIWATVAPLAGVPGARPALKAWRAGDKRDVLFQTVPQSRAFAAASGDARLPAGVALIRAVGDGSGLTLDNQLATYYAMDAATVKLPRLMGAVVAATRATRPLDRAFAMGEVANFADSSAYDMRRAISQDETSSAQAALTDSAANLAATVKRFRAQAGVSGPLDDAALAAPTRLAIDQTLRADRAELVHMLDARRARLQMRLSANLTLVIVSLGFAVALMIAGARGMTGRLSGLLKTMDRLNAGDTTVEIPYLDDRNETGQIAATLAAFKQGLINAVEERRRVEAANEALRESEMRYRLLADNATDVILRFDLDGRVAYASPSVRQYGVEPDDLIGGFIGRNMPPEDAAMVLQLVREMTEGKPGRRGEWRVLRADGGFHWLEGVPAPIFDEAGILVGVLAAVRNVDDRKAAELALSEMNAELMRVTRVSALGAFATSIAHEINQPLAAVVTNSETAMRWLANTPSNLERATEAIGRVARDALRASEVVRRMRSLVTRQDAKLADFDVNEAIDDVLRLVESERQSLNVEAIVGLSEGRPAIHGDRVQFQQVMLNLILNALDAMREAPVGERRLMIRSRGTEDGDIQVEVEDRGGGIATGSADRIFEKLFTTKVGGTGLGLAIARSIVEAHGGQIWAEPAAPRGAVFKFKIPCAEPDPASVRPRPVKAAAARRRAADRGAPPG